MGYFVTPVGWWGNVLARSFGLVLGNNAFFPKRADSLCSKRHGNLLSVNHEGFLLKVWLKHALGATQRKANIVAELLAFTSKFTLRCHNFPFTLFNNLY